MMPPRLLTACSALPPEEAAAPATGKAGPRPQLEWDGAIGAIEPSSYPRRH